MKKRTAIILFGTLLCSIGGYVAWCLRPFYLPPSIEFVGDVSPGGRKAAEEWRWSESYPKSRGFDWYMARENLCHPWDCRMGDRVRVEGHRDSGLWAYAGHRFWGFSKTGGEWDASTVMEHTNYFYPDTIRKITRQGEIASRIDAMAEKGSTIELLSLGPFTHRGDRERGVEDANDPDRKSPDVFHYYEVLGRAVVADAGERQQLFDCFSRSIREANVEAKLPGWNISPPFGIIISEGEVRTEYLVSFEKEDGYGFGSGIEGIAGFEEAGRPSSGSPSENVAFFRINVRYRNVFDAVLDRDGIERSKRAGE